MESTNVLQMPASTKTVGKLQLGKSKVLIPEMNRSSAHLFAAALRAFAVDAQVLATGRGLELGKKYTSGKECYPCLVTLGDLLHFIDEEKRRLGRPSMRTAMFSSCRSLKALAASGCTINTSGWSWIRCPACGA